MLAEIFSPAFFPSFDLNRTVLFYVFCGLALLFIFVRRVFQKDWVILWESFRSSSRARMHHQQGNLRLGLAVFLLLLIASAIFGILIHEYGRATSWALVEANFDFLSLLAAIFTFIVLRLLVFGAFTFLLPNHKEGMLYVKTLAVFCIYSSFALVPLALLTAFNDSINPRLIFGTFLLIMAVFVGGRVFRGLGIARAHYTRRKDYFFLYLCGLEIMPIALFIKGFGHLFEL